MTDLMERLQKLLGPAGFIEGSEVSEAAPLLGRVGTPSAVLRPASTEQVSAVLRLCNEARQAIVPWGGKTGLVEGTYAQDMPALSLERMNKIQDVDAENGTMTVEAGCILQNVCEAAEAKGLFFPLDLGARGSATIGGNIATNAGGNRVIRYGMTRDLILGLEVVLADGTIVSSMNTLIKNNAGYDIKSMFIGSEGTLGVITRAVLRLRPKPASQNVAFLAVDGFDHLPKLLRRFDRDLGGTLSAFEVMWKDYYHLVTTAPAPHRAPLPHGHSHYVLIEALGGDEAGDNLRFQNVLAGAMEDGTIADAVIAQSQGDRDRLWAMRDDVGQLRRYAPMFAFDVSLKRTQFETFIDEIRAALAISWPQATLMTFGHLGDGNVHVLVGVGSHDHRGAIEKLVYGALQKRGGSISAEHGIGLEKREYLSYCRSPAEIALMQALKNMLDPRGILNPGKVFADEPAHTPSA